MRRFILSFLLCPSILLACRPAPEPPAVPVPVSDPALDALLGLMQRRLDVMQDVARWKWATRSPIEDPDREAALLKDVVERGRALGLDPSTTRAFFAAQVEAAKRVQRDCFRRWEASGQEPAGEAPNLAQVLRPRIDALNRDLLAALARLTPLPHAYAESAALIRGRADAILKGAAIDDEVRALAIRPLVHVTE